MHEVRERERERLDERGLGREIEPEGTTQGREEKVCEIR